MSRSFNLLTASLINVIAGFLVNIPVEAVVANKLPTANQPVKTVQVKSNQQLKDEALRLSKLGLQQLNTGKPKEALNNFEKALAISKQVGDKKGEGVTLNYIGLIYRNLEQYRKALDYYQQSLAIIKQVGDKKGEGRTLSNIGIVYGKLGQYRKALDYYQQSLAIIKQVGDKKGEGRTLYGIGGVYDILGKYPKALDYYQKSFAITKQVGDKKGEGRIINNIGAVYNKLGQYRKALDYYQQSLAITKQIGDKKSEGTTLNNIGAVYRNLGEYPKALDYYQLSLAIRKQIGNKSGEDATLNNIGTVYDKLGQYPKALDYYQQSLAISKQFGNKLGEGTTLNAIGVVYFNLGEYPKALDYYQQALAISKQIGDKSGEGRTLNNIGFLFKAQKQPRLAIVFYKQSVSTYEQIRTELRTLPKQQQESYTKTVAHTYRNLADLLIKEDRILEAQQVLDLLKIQELENYLTNVRGSGEKLVILKPEQEILKKYGELQTSAINLGKELTQLRKIPPNSRTQAQEKRIAQLVNLERELNKKFNNFASRKDVVAQLNKLSRQAQKISVDLADLDSLRDDLKRLNAAIIYPLILEDRLELIITTPDSPPLRRTVKVKRKQLNKAITQFRQDLKISSGDINKSASQLYNWLIKPLEKDLKESGVETIIYAPDAQLRYIPLAALFDGEKWLIERFNINNITAKSLTDFTEEPQKQPSVLAGAFVNGKYDVKVKERNYPFAGLSYAAEEVANIKKLIPNTTKLIDKEFSKTDTTTKMNEYNIVHFATHAALVAGDPSESFIIFGDGETANVRDIGSWTLNNVDLVVLSACETGISDKFGNGEEILGLGYQFQSRGVRATIASLWVVDDEGTQKLMSSFYNALTQGNMTKAQALRQAQLKLINSNSTLDHPRFWAPFILIGNGL
ncbi:MAG: tetratricopeptide repeat protein [Cyanobacteria bacterium J06643_5]